MAGRRGLVAAMLMVGAALLGCGPDSPALPTPSGSGAVDTAVDTTVDTALATACPPRSKPVTWPPHGRLPDGATTVRLCNVPDHEGTRRSDLSLQEPVDALVTGVRQVTDTANSLPSRDPDAYCGGVGAPVTAFWFGYPDGREYAVEYPNGGCWTLLGPHDERDDGGRLQTAFVTALRAQRGDRIPPQPPSPPRCAGFGAQPFSTVVDVGSLPLVTAVACHYDDRSVRRAVLTPAELAVVSDDVHAESARTSYRTCEPVTATTLVGYDAWGDLVSIGGQCGVYFLPGLVYDPRRQDPVWIASPAVQTMLAGLDYGPPHRIARR